MRISDWSSDVCSSDLLARRQPEGEAGRHDARKDRDRDALLEIELGDRGDLLFVGKRRILARAGDRNDDDPRQRDGERSEEHPSELQSLMRISYAVFCLKHNNQTLNKNNHTIYPRQWIR